MTHALRVEQFGGLASRAAGFEFGASGLLMVVMRQVYHEARSRSHTVGLASSKGGFGSLHWHSYQLVARFEAFIRKILGRYK